MTSHVFVRKSFSASLMLLLLGSLTISLISPQLSLAQEDELKRQDIMNIARRYESHSWTATQDNAFHKNGVLTPNREHFTTWRAWKGWGIGNNAQVPYQWNGWSALEDEDLALVADYDGNFFDQQLNNNYAAGDCNTDFIYRDQDGHGTCGVDCSGLVSRAWRTGSKYGSWGLFNETRPILFKDLRDGDLLYRPGHVMLFAGFATPEKDKPGTTRITVIEASGYDWKVSAREYLLTHLRETSEYWSETNYQTNRVTLQRVADGENFTNYLPRTYLNPLDVMLLIDRSGSMGSEGKMDAAKNAAKMFVDLMRTRDKIGVVDFDDVASLTRSLTQIDADRTVITDTKEAIDGLFPRNYTSIGGALLEGHQELNAKGADDPVRTMILLSDGLENSSPYVRDVLSDIVDDQIVVHTVGLGSNADQDLLHTIAKQTGGEYRFSPSAKQLQEIYNAISAKVYGTEVVRRKTGTVMPGETAVEQVLVDSTIGNATFLVSWLGSDVDLSLVRPDGTVIDPAIAQTDPNISFTSGDTYEFYRIYAPQYGTWELQVFGKSVPAAGEDYTISVTARDAMIFTATSDKPKYYINEPIKITASIQDSFLDVAEPQYILGSLMEVTAEDPVHNSYHLELYDDGLHGDGAANDGIYANTFSDTSSLGTYDFRIAVSGQNNRHRQDFTREYDFSTIVSDDPPEPTTLHLSADPASILADGASTSTITAVMEDQYANPIQDGTQVDFTTDLGSISPPSDTTLGGIATSTLTAAAIDGTATVTATANSLTATTTVTFTAPEPVGGLTHPSLAGPLSISRLALAALVSLILTATNTAIRKRRG